MCAIKGLWVVQYIDLYQSTVKQHLVWLPRRTHFASNIPVSITKHLQFSTLGGKFQFVGYCSFL